MVAQAAPTPTAPTAAASKEKPPYDPFKAVVGMFNGTLIRLGQVFKDPKNYAESTPFVIAECAKRYQDALDDCEIRILDAKWYLEHRLAENKRRRDEALKAKETSQLPAITKRKHDEITESVETQQDTPSKRAKADEKSDGTGEDVAKTGSKDTDQQRPEEPSQQPARSEPQQPAAPESQPQPSQDQSTQDKSPPEPPNTSEPQPQPNDSKPTSTQPTPAADPEDFFESMFTEPPEDSNDPEPTNDTKFDLLNTDFASTTANQPPTQTQARTQTQSTTQPPQPQPQQQQPPSQSQPQPDQQAPSTSSFTGILPGLEQYANQTDSQPDQNPFTSSFEPNIFDSMLNDDTFDLGGDAGSGTGMDFSNMDMNMNMDIGGVEDLRDVNLDDIFGD